AERNLLLVRVAHRRVLLRELLMRTSLLFGALALTALGCSGSDDASSSPPATLDASCPDAIATPPFDASIADAGVDVDVVPVADASDATDAGTAPDVTDATPPPGLACGPQPIGFPLWAPPIDPVDVCSSSDIDTILNDCFTAFDATKCRQDETSLAACYGCMLTFDDDDRWGAFIGYEDRYYTNLGGCLAIQLGDTSTTGCGAARGPYDDCEGGACDRCWGADAGTIEGGVETVVDECFATAYGDGGLCATQYEGYLFACPPTSLAYRVCYEQQGEVAPDYFHRVAAVFCSAGDA